jgi:hypothetical protein
MVSFSSGSAVGTTGLVSLAGRVSAGAIVAVAVTAAGISWIREIGAPRERLTQPRNSPRRIGRRVVCPCMVVVVWWVEVVGGVEVV